MKKVLLLLITVTLLLAACTQETAETQDTATVPVKEINLGYVEDNNDIHITDAGTTLKNMVIEGDLYIDETVGEGEFYLENVEVKGTIYVNGAGPNSGYLINVTGNQMHIESKTNPNIKLSMGSSLQSINIANDCSVYTDGEGIEHVKINNAKSQEAVNVLLQGSYPDVSIESTANVTIDGKVSLMAVLEKAGMTSIDMVDTSKMYFYSCYGQSVTVHGGAIVEAWINAEYCSLPENVEKLRSEAGVAEVTLGDVTYYHIPPYEPNDQPTDESEDEQTEDTGILLAGYPTSVQNAGIITITVSASEKCTAYFLVEDEYYGSLGSIPEDVRNGISKGAGAVMPDGSGYIVIADSFNVATAMKEYSTNVNLSDYIPEFEADPAGAPDGDMGGTTIFLVIEDSEGNLSQVFTLR